MDFHWLVVPFFVWILCGETWAEKWNQNTERDADQNSRNHLDNRRDRRYTSSYGSSDHRDRVTDNREDRHTANRDRNSERGNDRATENGRDRGYDSNRDRGFDADRNRGNDRNRGQNDERDSNRGTSSGYESDGNRGNSFDQGRDRNRGNGWNNGNDRNRESGWNNENDRNKGSGWNNGNDRNRENGWNNGNDRDRESNRYTGNDRENDRKRENNHYHENDRDREDHRDTRHDHDRDRKKNGKEEQLVRAYWPWVDQKFPRPVQSPVAISTKKAKKEALPVLNFENYWENTKEHIRLRNDGNTVQILISENIPEEDRPKINGGPLRDDYLFEQMHMHWGRTDDDGSEHTLNGKSFSTEMHIVHFKREYGSMAEAQKHYDGIAVVAFFGTARGRDNKALGGYINDLESVRRCNSNVTITVKRTFECVKDIAAENRYYAYPGSLTTSPFSESVIWIVFPEPFLLSSRQLNEFRQLRSCDNKALIRKNDRELQPFNDRPVIFAF